MGRKSKPLPKESCKEKEVLFWLREGATNQLVVRSLLVGGREVSIRICTVLEGGGFGFLNFLWDIHILSEPQVELFQVEGLSEPYVSHFLVGNRVLPEGNEGRRRLLLKPLVVVKKDRDCDTEIAGHSTRFLVAASALLFCLEKLTIEKCRESSQKKLSFAIDVWLKLRALIEQKLAEREALVRQIAC